MEASQYHQTLLGQTIAKPANLGSARIPNPLTAYPQTQWQTSTDDLDQPPQQQPSVSSAPCSRYTRERGWEYPSAKRKLNNRSITPENAPKKHQRARKADNSNIWRF
jgi:hypothetical protein